MKLTPDTLEENSYTFLHKVKHAEFSSFLSKHRWKFSRLYFIYILFVLIFILSTVFFFTISTSPIFLRLLYGGLGILLAFLLIPLHEYIHLLTYKYFGAKCVTITSYPRQGYVLTKADHFVVGKKEMKWIATTPFLFISTIGAILLLFTNPLWQISVSSMILFHLTLCIADFRILDYFLSSKLEKVMYSDIPEEVTYIYEQAIKA